MNHKNEVLRGECMNFYVDEMPKSCFNCKCSYVYENPRFDIMGMYCAILKEGVPEKDRRDDCPLKEISTQTTKENGIYVELFIVNNGVRQSQKTISIKEVARVEVNLNDN